MWQAALAEVPHKWLPCSLIRPLCNFFTVSDDTYSLSCVQHQAVPGGVRQCGRLPSQKSLTRRRPARCSSGSAPCTTQPLASAMLRSSSAGVGSLHTQVMFMGGHGFLTAVLDPRMVSSQCNALRPSSWHWRPAVSFIEPCKLRCLVCGDMRPCQLHDGMPTAYGHPPHMQSAGYRTARQIACYRKQDGATCLSCFHHAIQVLSQLSSHPHSFSAAAVRGES